MGILHIFMEKQIKVFTTKERYELGNNINTMVLAFGLCLAAEIERSTIASRTKEALARKKSEGKRLGRPKGSLSKQVKLNGKDEIIKEFIRKRVPYSVIARILEVNRLTLKNYVDSRRLRE